MKVEILQKKGYIAGNFKKIFTINKYIWIEDYFSYKQYQIGNVLKFERFIKSYN